MELLGIILFVVLVLLIIANVIAFYKIERLIKINKGWFPFFHLIIAYLILGAVTFGVSLFFNFASAGFANQGNTSISVAGGGFANQGNDSLGLVVQGPDNNADYAKKLFIQSSIFYVLSLIGMLLPLVYFTYLLTRLAGLRGYFTILGIIPVIGFFYFPYLYLRISKKFKKGVGSALLLLFFEPIYFPILILKNEKDYLGVDTPVELSNKEIGIIYGIVVLLIGSFFIVGKYLENKNNSAQTIAIDIARKANLSQLSTALTMYFNDNGEYPNSLGNALVPAYLMDIPTDPQTHKNYFYRPISCKGTKNAGFILATKMSNPSDCNVDIYSTKELGKLINKLENDNIKDTCSKIDKIIQTDLSKSNFKKGCYYIQDNG